MTAPYQQPHPSGAGPQPAPGTPPAGAPGGPSAIAVTTKFFWLSWIFALIKPKLFLNGQEIPAQWGRNVVPVQPGQHHLHVHVPYFLPPKIGPADLTVPVQPGQAVEIEYRAPVWQFSRGSLGPPPQQYNGVGITIGILVGFFVLFCICCGGAIAASA